MSGKLKSALAQVAKSVAEQEHSTGYLQQHRRRFEITLHEVVNTVDEIQREAGRPARLVDIGSHELHSLLALRLIFPDVELTGVDVDYFNTAPHIVRLAEEHRINLVLFESLEAGIPLEDKGFDVVLFFETLEHLNFYPLPVFRELARIVAPGGRLMVTTPNQLTIGMLKHFLLRRSIHQNIEQPYTLGTHYRCFTLDEVSYLMKESGLAISRRGYLEFPPMYLGAWQRVLHGLIAGLFRWWANSLLVVGKKE